MKKCFAGLCTLAIAWTIAVPAYAQQRAAASAPAKKPGGACARPRSEWRLVRHWRRTEKGSGASNDTLGSKIF